MGKRHNRKRIRSRPRHRDGGCAKGHPNHIRTMSMDTNSSHSTLNSNPLFQTSNLVQADLNPADHWHNTYSAWQNRVQYQREQAMEAYCLRVFGGEAGEEASLLEPMLKVVMDLFDGDTDYQDP
ncbi:hypothetical protein K504DRAFT_497590 [Pleomassaria siparia CBS 279.74]|uniref:Uncharacterized protein n=1 Tax=Pleomassaria siparia CBS 279.74 TaxID=1314801 RepID=A0A6G1KSB9_9PLEO|nr:hypothetical protein K504DRAFT_497590 [Pleomassaria siparia CBS 279.74]